MLFRSMRPPGKQKGAPGANLPKVINPDEVIELRPVSCRSCGRRRMYTRTLYEAKTMRRRCGGMSFNAGELGIAYKENSSDDQRERVAEFGQAGTFIGLTAHDPWQRT